MYVDPIILLDKSNQATPWQWHGLPHALPSEQCWVTGAQQNTKIVEFKYPKDPD